MQRTYLFVAFLCLTVSGISPVQGGQILFYEDFEGTPEGQVPSSLYLIGAGATDFAQVTRPAARTGEKGLHADLTKRSQSGGQYSWGEVGNLATPTSEVNFYSAKASIAYQSLPSPGTTSFFQFRLDGLIGSTATSVALATFYDDGRIVLYGANQATVYYAPLSYQDFEFTFNAYNNEVKYFINGVNVLTTLQSNWSAGPMSFRPTSVSFTATGYGPKAPEGYVLIDNISVEASYVTPAPIPEPGAVVLGLVGALGGGILVRRHSKAAAR